MVRREEPELDHVRAWFEAAARPEIESEIEEIHTEVAETIRRIGPLCLASGHCCRFEAHGHRLYASGLEVARCVAICRDEGRGIELADIDAAIQRGNCPWQDGRLCTARAGRPSGCRVYFCDPRAAELVPEIAERAHAGIKAIHEHHGIPYVYGEWRAMLREVVGEDLAG